ncbi:Serine/threonine-protein phosphatase PP1 [Halotydeus destructor]|nr:Serine/threonine-protein phosphatase PP1 [Halotydeus destructor]
MVDNKKKKSNKPKTKPAGFAVTRTSSLESLVSLSGSNQSELRVPEKEEGHAGHELDQYHDHIYDCCAVLITCNVHQNIALSTKNNRTWLPCVPLTSTDSWLTASRNFIDTCLTHGKSQLLPLPVTKPHLLHLQQVQLPEVMRTITRIIVGVTSTAEMNDKGWICCSEDEAVKWLPISDLVDGKVANLWGPEIPKLIAASFMISEEPEVLQSSVEEMYENLLPAPEVPAESVEHQLIRQSNYKLKDLNKIYGDYLQHCFPSFVMTKPSFANYMLRIGFEKETEMTRLFNAFSSNRQNFIQFREFLFGLIAMEASTVHEGFLAAERTRFIFRFYDSDNDGVLSEIDVLKMVTDISTQGKPVDAGFVEQEATSRWNCLMSVQKELNVEAVTEQVLVEVTRRTLLGSLKFSGLELLFRSAFPILQAIYDKNVYETISGSHALAMFGRKREAGICPSCRPKRYKFEPFSVKLDVNGRTVQPFEIDPLKDDDEEDSPSNSTDIVTPEHTDPWQEYSRDIIFNPTCTVNRVLTTLRVFDLAFFSRGKYPIPNLDQNKLELIRSASAKAWFSNKKQALDTISNLVDLASEIVSQESRILKVQSPVYILGDIHGNFSDLMTYERNLWSSGPWVNGTSYLFLGDYVDRGTWSVECTCYLMALKVLAPHRFFLLRGNHEIRSIAKMFTFYRECITKYDREIGKKIFEKINEFFDRLPVAAVIDENIFCAHGGIPFSGTKIDEIEKTIPCPLQEPQLEAPSAWEMLWNDPMNRVDFEKLDSMINRPTANQGFIVNNKRGTAYYYTEEAVERFLAINGYTHIIRGHELVKKGYKFHMNSKVITIFSTSNYSGQDNTAAVILVDNEKITIISVDTSDEIN